MVSAEPYVIDSSATVEYLLDTEVGSQVAELIAGARLIAPEMLDAEVLSALRRGVQAQEISGARALEALARLENLPVERVSHRTFTRAAWALRHNVSAYDALYVAIAQERGATLLTFDRPLSRAVASMPDVNVVVRYVGVS